MNSKKYQSNLKKKLILGTAQFGHPYGINNIKKKRITLRNINKIFEFYTKNNLSQIDTAESYGVNFDNLKKFNFKIDTKIILNKKKQNENELIDLMNKYKIQKKKSLNTIYIHNAENLFLKSGKKMFNFLKNFKKKKFFNKIGISIYDLYLLKKIIKNFKIDVVQVPYSILDRRFENYFRVLKKKKISIHVRSIFLQGALISDYKNFITKSPEVKNFKKLVNKYKINSKYACIHFVLKNKLVDKIIIGVDNYKQLKEILGYSFNEKFNYLEDISSLNTKIIDPRNWRD